MGKHKIRQNIVAMQVVFTTTIMTCQQETCDRKSLSGFPICRRCLDQHIKKRYQDDLIYLDIHTTGIDLCIIVSKIMEKGCKITYYNDKFGLQDITKPRYFIKSIRMPNGRHRGATPEEENLVKVILVPTK